jgi:hypothetical protein
MLSNVGFVGNGDAFNDTARVVAESNVIACYPDGGYHAGAYLYQMQAANQTAQQAAVAFGATVKPGQWPVDNFDRSIRIHGFYST